ncbi:MAG: ATPase, partial [Bacillaceae bacterium]|nr:ATPase [Bacillaceae bacterium]
MGNKYKNDFLDLASKLDALVGKNGEITKNAIAIADYQDQIATITLLKQISEVVDLKSDTPEVKLLAKALKDSLIKYFGYMTVLDICNKDLIVEDKRTLPELLSDLNELIGLKNVKTKVNDLIAYQKVQQMRKTKGLPSTKNTLHLAFMGKP